MILIADPEMIKEIAVKQFNNFSDRQVYYGNCGFQLTRNIQFCKNCTLVNSTTNHTMQG